MDDRTQLALAFGEVFSVAEWAAEQDCECTPGSYEREPEVCLGCYARDVVGCNSLANEVAERIAEEHCNAEIEKMEQMGTS